MHTLFPPSEALASYVDRYYYTSVSGKGKMFPFPQGHMTFFLDNPVKVRIGKNKLLLKGAMLGGQIRKYFAYDAEKPMTFFGVSFKPTGMYRLFKYPVNNLLDLHVPLADIVGNEAEDLHKKVLQAPEIKDKIAVVEEYLLKLAEDPEYVPPVIVKIIHDIEAFGGMINISELIDMYKVSRRYLEKYFLTIVGIAPGRYCRIMRFLNVLQELEKPGIDPSDIIANYGYYDHSHLIKDFEFFMEEKPSDYLRNDHPLIAKVMPVVSQFK